jgi:hypothetical protein
MGLPGDMPASRFAQSNGPASPRSIHHSTPLHDHDLPHGHKASRCTPGRLHEIAPLFPIRPDQSGRLAGADRGTTGTTGKQVTDGLLKQTVHCTRSVLAASV